MKAASLRVITIYVQNRSDGLAFVVGDAFVVGQPGGHIIYIVFNPPCNIWTDR